MLKAVIFDIGDTLWGLEPLPANLEDRMVERLVGRSSLGASAAAEVVRSALDAARARTGDGTHREANIALELGEAARRARADIPREVIVEVADVIGEADISRFLPNQSLAVVFADLHAQGVRVGVLSNTWTRGALLEDYLTTMGARGYLAHGVYSGDEGIRKPHHDIYRRALDGLNAEGHETLFVGDRVLEDVIGPSLSGMRALLTHEYRREDPADARPLAVIDRLSQVVDIVRDINTASDE